MSDDIHTPEDGEGGYCKPPKSKQFKPGTSGNPKGRPKGPGNIHKLLAKHAGKKVTVVINGEEKKMSKMDVVLSALFNKAAKGDVGATRLIATMAAAAQLEGDDYQPGSPESAFNDDDHASLMEELGWLDEVRNAHTKEKSDGSE